MGGGGKIRFATSMFISEILGSSEEESDEQKGPDNSKIASSSDEGKELDISKYLNDNDINLIQKSWDEHLKKSPDFAPKVFLQ